MKRIHHFSGLIILVLLFLAQTTTLFSQKKMGCTSAISGYILDEHDQSPLEFAKISIIELRKVVYSDEKGFYVFDSICPGTYTFQVEHPECQPIEKTVVVNGRIHHDFFPEHHILQVNEVTVHIHKQPIQSTQTQDQLSQREMEESKGLSLGESLKNVPGVATVNTGNSISKPVLHGMHSNRLLILNNEIRQEGQQWGIEHAPEIDPLVAGKLSVVKGANSVRYGSDAIAGVVLVDLKPLRDSVGMNGEVNAIGMTNGRGGTFSGYLDGKFRWMKALSWRVQGTYKRSGNISAPNYMIVNTGVKEYNFSYDLTWKKERYGAELYYSQFNTNLGIFSGSHIGNLTDLQTAMNSSVPLETGGFTYKIGRPYQHIEHELLKAKAYYYTGKNSKLTFIYARQYNLRNEYDKHPPLNDALAALNKPELLFKITTHTADLAWEHHLFHHVVGTVGFSGIHQANTYEGRALIPNFRNQGIGAYWIERLRLHKYEIEAGVRFDYRYLQVYKYKYISGNYKLITPDYTYHNVAYNVGFIYKPDTTLNVSLNLGSAWRPPSISELYSDGLHHSAAAVEYGNDTLGTEVAYTATLTIRYAPVKKLFVEVTPYFNYIKNYIYRKAMANPVLLIQGAFPAYVYTQSDAILKGVDFYADYQLTKELKVVGKASILRAWNKTENDWLVLIPADRGELEFSYQFKDRKKISGSYISLGAQYVNKQWRVPDNSDFLPPPNDYTLLTFHAGTTVHFKNQPVEFGLSVYNLANKSYRDYLDRFRYYIDEPGRNIVLRIKVPFNIPFRRNS